MLNLFKERCLKYKDKIAVIDGKKQITFKELLNDIFKMIQLFQNKGIKEHEKVLLFLTPSYDFYVLLLSSIYYQLNIVVCDSFKNKGIKIVKPAVFRHGDFAALRWLRIDIIKMLEIIIIYSLAVKCDFFDNFRLCLCRLPNKAGA